VALVDAGMTDRRAVTDRRRVSRNGRRASDPKPAPIERGRGAQPAIEPDGVASMRAAEPAKVGHTA
jgi:hypothetical protein